MALYDSRNDARESKDVLGMRNVIFFLLCFFSSLFFFFFHFRLSIFIVSFLSLSLSLLHQFLLFSITHLLLFCLAHNLLCSVFMSPTISFCLKFVLSFPSRLSLIFYSLFHYVNSSNICTVPFPSMLNILTSSYILSYLPFPLLSSPLHMQGRFPLSLPLPFL